MCDECGIYRSNERDSPPDQKSAGGRLRQKKISHSRVGKDLLACGQKFMRSEDRQAAYNFQGEG
jgi:hypothetical protein